MLPSYLCAFDKLLVDSWQIKIANMYRNLHASKRQKLQLCGNASNNVALLIYASKRQKPTAQGNTLGKHPHMGLRPIRAKALHIKTLRMLLSLQDVPTPSHITRGVARAMRYCPCGGVCLMAGDNDRGGDSSFRVSSPLSAF